MDTVAACILASELPKIAKNQSDVLSNKDFEYDPKANPKQLETILDETLPFNDKEGLLRFDMKFNIAVATIYQQIVLTILYYHGRLWFDSSEPEVGSLDQVFGPKNWYRKELQINTELKGDEQWRRNDDEKATSYTFIFQTFFMMQLFNMITCQFSYNTSRRDNVMKIVEVVKNWKNESRAVTRFHRQRITVLCLVFVL